MAILERGDGIAFYYRQGPGADRDSWRILRDVRPEVQGTELGTSVQTIARSNDPPDGALMRVAACQEVQSRDLIERAARDFTRDGQTLVFDRYRILRRWWSDASFESSMSCDPDFFTGAGSDKEATGEGTAWEPPVESDEATDPTDAPDEETDPDEEGATDPTGAVPHDGDPLEEDVDTLVGGIDPSALPWWLWLLAFASAVHFVTRRS